MISDRVLSRLKKAAELPDLSGTRYRLIDQIGRGGMGVVYAAEDMELGRKVAIKILDGPEEARILATLEHPGIVPVHDCGVLPDGRFYYAMKLVRGARLDAYLQSTAHLPDRLRVFQKICEPVAFAHARGVVHRDLKPANIMVGEFGEVLVMDWGAPGVGTAAFMAPEQAAGGAVDGRADVFALGRILELLVKQEARVPKPLASICRRATEPDRGLRYASPSDMAADIAAYLDHIPVSAHPESAGEKLLRFGSRNRVLLTLAAAYVVMRIAIILWLGR
jgi:serine/threonine protein kinase